MSTHGQSDGKASRTGGRGDVVVPASVGWSDRWSFAHMVGTGKTGGRGSGGPDMELMVGKTGGRDPRGSGDQVAPEHLV